MKQFWLSLMLAVICLTLFSSLALSQSVNGVARPGQIVIRGKVVCLDESGRRLASEHNCQQPSHRFGFDTSDGKFYLFLRSDSATAMFFDPRVCQRELQITARLDAEGQLEIIKVHSIHQGRLYDIYYFCEICNITAYAPGPCHCCRQEFELKETPVPEP